MYDEYHNDTNANDTMFLKKFVVHHYNIRSLDLRSALIIFTVVPTCIHVSFHVYTVRGMGQRQAIST